LGTLKMPSGVMSAVEANNEFLVEQQCSQGDNLE